MKSTTNKKLEQILDLKKLTNRDSDIGVGDLVLAKLPLQMRRNPYRPERPFLR